MKGLPRDTQHGSRPNLRRRDPKGRIVPTPSNVSDKGANTKKCVRKNRHKGQSYVCISLLYITLTSWSWRFSDLCKYLVVRPPQKSCDSRAPLGLPRRRGAATSHTHNSTTTCRRKNGRRCPTSARGERGNRPPGDGSLAPPLFLRRCPLFFFRTPITLHLRIAFWLLEPWTEPWTRDDKRACVNSNHNNTRTNHSSVQPSLLAVRRIGNTTAFRLAPGMAGNSKQLQIPPSPRALLPSNWLLLPCQVYCSTYCCIAVLLYWVGPWVDGGCGVVPGINEK